MRQTFFRIARSIVGIAFIGLGLSILFGNLTNAAARLSGFIGIGADTTQTFGEVTVVGLAAAHALQCYLFDRVGFAEGICKILISLWPLLLVVAGALLTGMASRTGCRNFQKNTEDVDLTDARSTRQ